MGVITRQALHVITGAICNEMMALQAVITPLICNSLLQDGVVITCNGGVVMGATRYRGGNGRSSTSLLRPTVKSVNPVVTPVLLSEHNNVDDQRPTCCQSEPLRCPACGSTLVMPTLLAIGEQQCWNDECCAIWTEEES